MQDRYLFKAKRKDDGEWVFGGLSYCEKTNAYFITNMGKDHISYIGFHQEVDSNTICQCTGLKDKNSRVIWENDIVKCLYNCYGEKYVYIGKVIYKEGTCRFVVANSKSTDYEWWNEEKEVIGNIFDNPELLESEE